MIEGEPADKPMVGNQSHRCCQRRIHLLPYQLKSICSGCMRTNDPNLLCSGCMRTEFSKGSEIVIQEVLQALRRRGSKISDGRAPLEAMDGRMSGLRCFSHYRLTLQINYVPI